MMRLRLLALLGALACGSPTEPALPALEFDSAVVFGIPTLPATATAEPGGMRVTGVLQTPTTGYTLFGTLRVTGTRTLRLDIEAQETQPGFFFTTQNAYRARVRRLEPGDYDVSVYHTNHGAPDPSTVLVYRQTVRVM